MKSSEDYLHEIKHQYVMYQSRENCYRPISRFLEKGKTLAEPREICVVIPISCLEELLNQNKE